MITNADITIFNRYLNKSTKAEEYRATVIRGVYWYTNQKTSVGEKGLLSADEYKIRIPADANMGQKTYIEPEKYRHLPLDKVDRYWTIDNGDYFIRGISDELIINPDIIKNAGRIVSYSINLCGINPHYRIGGA